MTEKAGSLAAALAEFQASLPDIHKSETADVHGTNKAGKPISYSYRYADLASISRTVLPLLGAVGLSWVTCPTVIDGRLVLRYELLHVSGEQIMGIYPLTGSTPQEIGSAITYARRYCLCSVTGVAPDEDDDGAAASSRSEDWDSAAPVPTLEQVELFDALKADVERATDADAIKHVGAAVRGAQGSGRITKFQYEQLARRASARLAELERRKVQDQRDAEQVMSAALGGADVPDDVVDDALRTLERS